MSLTVACPTCGKYGTVPDEALSRRVRCPGCGARFEASPTTMIGPSNGELNQVPGHHVRDAQVDRDQTSDSWYYARGDEQHGPVSFRELDLLAGSGQLARGDLVWAEGRENWDPASAIPGLSFPAPKPPPLPRADRVDSPSGQPSELSVPGGPGNRTWIDVTNAPYPGPKNTKRQRLSCFVTLMLFLMFTLIAFGVIGGAAYLHHLEQRRLRELEEQRISEEIQRNLKYSLDRVLRGD